MVRTFVASWAFFICFQFLNLLPDFNSTKFNQRRPLPSCEFLPPSCWIFYNSAVHFHCIVCTSHKNISACDTDNEASAATSDPVFIWGSATLYSSVHFPIVLSSRSFCQDFNFWDGRVTRVMSVSAALFSSFISLTQLHISHSRMGRTSRFTSFSFGYNHDFTILCNSHDVFFSPQKIGPRIEGRMTKIGTDVVVFLCPA